MRKSGFRAWLVPGCLSLSMIMGLTAGCTTGVPTVTFEQLFTAPGKYNGKRVIVEGFFFHGFESNVFSERLENSGLAEGHLWPKGRMLWLEGGIPREIYDRLNQQGMMGPTERYGKLSVTGGFEHGGKYGHLGQFEHRLTPSAVLFIE